LSRARRAGGAPLAERNYRALPRHAARVVLRPGRAALRRLRAAGHARLTSVSHGTSHKGPTTTIVDRAL